MANKETKILILGGGFGGIKAALGLAGKPGIKVILLSDQDSFRYYPTLYHAATGGRMTAASIPLEEIFKNKNIAVEKGTAKKIDRQARTVRTSAGKDYGYDKLIISLGVVTNYFGIKGLKEYSYGIKSQAESRRLRDHIHRQLIDEGRPDLNYVVIGGGPTGVELAGALPAYIRHVMKMHGLRDRKLNIELIEAAPRLVPRMPKDYSRAIAKHLRKLGIRLYLGQAVQAETADSLTVSGRPLRSHTVIWTAGVTNHPFFDANKFAFGEHGKVAVDKYLQAEEDIFVIGDNADTEYSGMAQTAIFDGKYVADNLLRQVEGKKPKSYRAKKPIYVTPAGPRWAAVLWNGVHIYGRLGWMMRSAADFVGYHDYEPWQEAGRHWIAEFENENSCPVCAGTAVS
ncbi:MAG TPA: FAD-dependent oxidoreductase [Candidatus Saccharimonadales bacterium]|nr:FAD-dependent oxidoreductase [Candidatus Saccharimonadales bacterium]